MFKSQNVSYFLILYLSFNQIFLEIFSPFSVVERTRWQAQGKDESAERQTKRMKGHITRSNGTGERVMRKI